MTHVSYLTRANWGEPHTYRCPLCKRGFNSWREGVVIDGAMRPVCPSAECIEAAATARHAAYKTKVAKPAERLPTWPYAVVAAGTPEWAVGTSAPMWPGAGDYPRFNQRMHEWSGTATVSVEMEAWRAREIQNAAHSASLNLIGGPGVNGLGLYPLNILPGIL